jgi:CPA1 family monovalent cation:H+ antiporter
MAGEFTVNAVEVFVVLLGAAVLVALVVRRLAVPYSVALVVAGLVAGLLLGHVGFAITPELVLAVLLPGLVFDAAYRLELGALRRSLVGIGLLAVPGVLASAAVVATVLHFATGLPFELAFVVGSMVSATDPAAVIAVFGKLGITRRLATLVEGESLFNDGTGLVIFALALRAVQATVTPSEGAVAFLATLLVSVLIGVASGLIASVIVSRVDDHLIELTITLVLAYGTYLVADAFHESGIIATVVAGLTLGNVGRRIGMSPTTQAAIDSVWEFLAFLLTALVFLLVGLAIQLEQLAEVIVPILWGVLGLLVGRVLVIYVLFGGSMRLARALRIGGSVPTTWLHVMFWSGLRGAVAVAMALSLPLDFPQRSLLQAITFGIVLFTLLVQGTTTELVVRRIARRGNVLANDRERTEPMESRD